MDLPRAVTRFTDQFLGRTPRVFDEEPAHGGLARLLAHLLVTAIAGLESDAAGLLLG